MSEPIDLDAVRRDDALIEAVRLREAELVVAPQPEPGADDVLTLLLLAWRVDCDRAPMPQIAPDDLAVVLIMLGMTP